MKAMFLVGFFLALFIALLLVLKPKKNRQDFWLISFFVIISIQLLLVYLYLIGFDKGRNYLAILDVIHWTLIGPVLFLYVRQVIYPNRRLKVTDLIHLLPILLVFITHGDYFLLRMNDMAIDEYTREHRGSPTLFIGSVTWGFSCVVYYILTLFLIQRHRKQIPVFFSNARRVNLRWLNYLTCGFGLFLFLEVLQFFGAGRGIHLFGFNLMVNSWIFLIIYVFAMGLIGFRQQGVFTDFDPLDLSVRSVNGNSPGSLVTIKYNSSRLQDPEKEAILMKLKAYMEKDQPWLDCDLDIKTVADQVGTTIHKLSQVLNQCLGKNFYDYINELRIEDVKKQLLLPKNQNLKIIAVAYGCGFNSKSAFYEAFRKSVGITPREFRDHSQAG